MNYYGASELRDKTGARLGRWHFTCTHHGDTWPVGYCAEGCPGHDTEDGAREHYRQYLLDTADFDGKYSTPSCCVICRAWTDRYASTGPGRMNVYTLCDAHRSRSYLAAYMPVPHSVASSY